MIKAISRASDRYGNKLLDMLDKYDKVGLRDLEDNEIREYYKGEFGDMIKFENECNNCGEPCLGDECNMKVIKYYYCDECKDEFEPDEIYLYNDKHLCRWCLLNKFQTLSTLE